MSKQTFTTGQVLTAAQMTSLQETAMGGGPATAKTASYVLTAADAGTTVIMNSGSATTITVDTGLFASGDTVLIQNIGAGVCTVTAGTATVNTAGSLALSQYEGGILYFTATGAAIFHDYYQSGGASGLTLLTNATFSAVSSYSLPANTFSSTYTNYLIVLDVTTFSANNTFIARMRSSGSDYSGTQYLNQRISGFGATIEASSGATNTSIDIGADVNSNTNYQLRLELYKPNVNVKKWFLSQQWFYDSAGNNRNQLNAGRIDQSTQYDSLSIIPSTGTMTGRIFCYGYAA